VTRSAVVDDLRQRLGGRELHATLKSLPALERDVFQRYYVEGASFGAVRRTVRDQGALLSTERLLEVLRAIEAKVGGRLARRLSYDLHAQSVGGASGRLLEYLDHARFEFEERSESDRADFETLDHEARRTLLRVKEELDRLPADERKLLSLRFEQGWTAQRIAEELGLRGQRSVYTGIDRIVRALRRRLQPGRADKQTGVTPPGVIAGDED
jgi:DNA-directed RNA polymerase specialized sigma subunit